MITECWAWMFFLSIAETWYFSGSRFCDHTGGVKTQEKRTTALLLPPCQFDNYSAFKLLSQWKGKLVNVLTRWTWSGKAKNSWETTDLASTFPPDQNHTITRQDGGASRTVQIKLISVVSDFQNAFICLISSRVGCSCSFGQKRNVFFLPTSSDWTFLKDYKGVLLCFMLQSAAAGMATLHRCWQWTALVRPALRMLELNSVSQSDGGPPFLQH